MSLITKRRLASLASASAIIATVAVAAAPGAAFAAKPTPGGAPSAKHAAAYVNDFKFAADAPGAMTTTDNQGMFDVTRVASGTDGIKASSGGYYAQAAHNDYSDGTFQPFTRYGGYSPTFDNGYTTSVDIYLDMSKATGGDVRFDWDSASSNSTGGYGRDFIFSVGTKPSVPGSFVVSASNNAPGNPSGGVAPVTISKSGWYTFKHTFRNDGGMLAVDMRVLDAKGVELAKWTRSDPSDIIGGTNATVGGNRYGWLVYNDFQTLALDNITRVQN
jgi:hypothetical protein